MVIFFSKRKNKNKRSAWCGNKTFAPADVHLPLRRFIIGPSIIKRSSLKPVIRALSSQSPTVLRSSLIARKTVSKGLLMTQKEWKNWENCRGGRVSKTFVQCVRDRLMNCQSSTPHLIIRRCGRMEGVKASLFFSMLSGGWTYLKRQWKGGVQKVPRG